MHIFLKKAEVGSLFGTVNYFKECFMSIVMNRLVTNEIHSLEEQYEELKNEISNLDGAEDTKQIYENNLMKAYEKIKDHIYRVEQEEVVNE